MRVQDPGKKVGWICLVPVEAPTDGGPFTEGQVESPQVDIPEGVCKQLNQVIPLPVARVYQEVVGVYYR